MIKQMKMLCFRIMHHSKINDRLIDNVEGLDIVMSKYNLLEYSQSMTSGCLQNYFSDEINEFGDNTSDGKSSEYKQIV